MEESERDIEVTLNLFIQDPTAPPPTVNFLQFVRLKTQIRMKDEIMKIIIMGSPPPCGSLAECSQTSTLTGLSL